MNIYYYFSRRKIFYVTFLDFLLWYFISFAFYIINNFENYIKNI